MSNARDIQSIVAELREQDWAVELQGGSSYKATPPGPHAASVYFTAHPTSGDSAQKILRDLKLAGLTWPPPKRDRPKRVPVPETVPPPKLVPKPETNGKPNGFHAAVMTAMDRVEPPAPDTRSEDSMFAILKEARMYASLAREELSRLKVERDAAQARVDAAQRECDLAEEALKREKAAFDRAFATGDSTI